MSEREADYAKRRADAAAADKKAATEARLSADNAANCTAARQNQRALDQGIRIANFDQNGERSIMGDAYRAQLAKNNAKVLADCK